MGEKGKNWHPLLFAVWGAGVPVAWDEETCNNAQDSHVAVKTRKHTHFPQPHTAAFLCGCDGIKVQGVPHVR